ncbi:hypothetical protein GP486_007708 [Trichoglossum hirsutum]|uniref:Uncharacterized protein n=1 Tax=Trichoglossum hirsutum TaxID=265104 RepID=A0A9P8IJA8_9PEZI|nr:hypothetical protein GP486_007708 [Trichoglossum hirsutum]
MCTHVDAEEHTKPSEDLRGSPEEHSEGDEATVGRLSESTICALMEEKRKQLDEEIAAFKAAKDEEFRVFERELREGRDAGENKKKGRGDAETFNAGKKRHREGGGGDGYATSSSPSRGRNSPKASDVQQDRYANELKSLRTHYRPGDQSPQTPPHEHELEFQGLFTPSFMTLLDCGRHITSTRPASERPIRPPSSESPPSSPSSPSSHPEQEGSAPLAQPVFTKLALPNFNLPHKARSSSFPPLPPPPQQQQQQQQQPTLIRSDSSTASLHSSIRHSIEGQKPRAQKQVKFKFDDVIVLPTASYDRSQEPAAVVVVSDDEKQNVGREEPDNDDTQKGVQKAETGDSSSSSRGSNLGNIASESKSESSPTGLLQNTDRQQPLQVEGNGSPDGLGGKWSTVKEKDVVVAAAAGGGRGGGGGSVRDERAEIITRAEYEGADEDDYDDGGIFDLDETMPDFPEPEESRGMKEKEGGVTMVKQSEKTTSPVDMPLFDPGSFRGHNLSLVVPTTIAGSATDHHYDPSLGRMHTRTPPAAIVGSAPVDLVFGGKRPEGTFPSAARSTTRGGTSGVGETSANRSRDLLGDARGETSITWSSSIRRRSSAKYDTGTPSDGNGVPTKGRRHSLPHLQYHHHGAATREGYDDSDEDAIISPMAHSFPVQIPASPPVGYTGSNSSHTSKTSSSKVEKHSVTPKKNSKNSRGKKRGAAAAAHRGSSSSPGSNAGETAVMPANDEATITATGKFSLSTSANISSVDNPITDQFATATIGGLHRNAFSPDSLGSCSPPAGPNHIMSNPFIGGSYASPSTIAMAKDMGNIGSYVGSIDGCSGYDEADRSSYLKLKRGRESGEPQSFSERMMLEEEMTAKQTNVKKAVRRATRP